MPVTTTTILGKEIFAATASFVSSSQATGTPFRVALLDGTNISPIYFDHNGITYNADTNQLNVAGPITATSITASLQGTSSYSLKSDTVLLEEENSTASTCAVIFAISTPGYQGLLTDANQLGGLRYQPSTNTLTTTNFAGNASTATNATNVAVTNTTTGTGPYYLMFADGTSGNRATRVDSSTLTYNATTNILTTTASLATRAESASAVLAGDFAAGTYSVPWMSQKTPGIATYFEGDTILQYETATGRLSTTTFNGAVTSTDLRVNGLSQQTGSLRILQTSNVSGSGITLRQQGTSNFWQMYVTASTGPLTNGLQFRYNGGNNGGYLDYNTNVSNIDFTGQHRSLSNTINITGSSDLTGLIVVADGTYTNLNNNHLPQINEALPNVSLSTTELDKRVFGVISDKEERGSRQYAMGSWVSTFDVSKTEEPRLIINSLGEGGMWICNANGTLENGDYITTSNLPGYGMKQSDDVLHNYTVAKITEDCLFDSIRVIDFEYSGSVYKKQFVGVTYHCG